jgi:hypothetical protein
LHLYHSPLVEALAPFLIFKKMWLAAASCNS